MSGPLTTPLSRRRFLRRGAEGLTAGVLAGLTGPFSRVAAANSPTGAGTASAVVFVRLDGGLSHVDSFDAKPGPWTPLDLDIGPAGGMSLPRALFPNLAALAERIAVIRSFTAWDETHIGAQYALQTGRRLDSSLLGAAPSVGSLIAHDTWGTRELGDYLPAFVAFDAAASQAGLVGAGALPVLAAPVRLTDDGDRRAALWRSDARVASALLVPPDRCARYGDTSIGRALARAANLVAAEAGTRFILVGSSGWDFHTDIYEEGDGSYRARCRELDRALGALVTELGELPSARGSLLDTTLIVCASEMGRTPGPPNPAGGRGHYPAVGSVVLAGGGVQGGRAIGATDATGAAITVPGWSAGRPVTAADLAATVQSAVGVDWTRAIRLANGTTISRLQTGLTPAAQPVYELFT